MKSWIAVLCVFASSCCNAQFSNRIWCFGDSAGIDFSNTSSPVPISSSMDGRGSCVSISDSLNKVIFYAYTRASMAGNTAVVRSWNDSIMVNGTNIVGEAWYNELMIVPAPQINNQFYLFSIGVAGSSQFGLYYSVIDMSLDSGRGEVIQKNIQLSNQEMFDCMAAVKSGNGRDWWLVTHASNVHGTTFPTSNFYVVEITPSGIQGPTIQSVGNTTSTDLGTLVFSNKGDQLAFVSFIGLIELYNFDRCAGSISMATNIKLEGTPYPWYSGAAFSSNDSVLYVSTMNGHPHIFQYDLSAANILASAQIFGTVAIPLNAGGFLRIGPDDKIYWSNNWPGQYPYLDSVYNNYNMNLSVINNPNIVGPGCNYQQYSFYLGGKRTYWDLPNNPDYEKMALGGSPCDTLGYPNSILSHENSKIKINIFYNPGWQTAFINASGLTGKNYSLHIVTMNGGEIYTENGFLLSEFFTKDFRCDKLASGTYLVLIETEKERLVKKFLIE